MRKQRHTLDPTQLDHPYNTKLIRIAYIRIIVAYSNRSNSFLRTSAIVIITQDYENILRNQYSRKKKMITNVTYMVLRQRQDSADQILTSLSSPVDTKSFPLAL